MQASEPLPEDSGEEIGKEEKEKRIREVKRRRHLLTGNFTADFPQFKEHFQELHKNLFYENEKGEKMQFFVLPSFFHLLIDLMDRKIDFVVVFRTFGEDLPKVVKEFNSFFLGEHPYPPFRSEKLVRLFKTSRNHQIVKHFLFPFSKLLKKGKKQV